MASLRAPVTKVRQAVVKARQAPKLRVSSRQLYCSATQAPRSVVSAPQSTTAQACSTVVASTAARNAVRVTSTRPYATHATAPEPSIHPVFENFTNTWQYIVADPTTKKAAIIDPVLDYDPATQKISTKTADALLGLIKEKGYQVDMILETHAHADHLTAASYLQKRLSQDQGERPPIGIGKRIVDVQKRWADRYKIPAEEYENVFDILWDDEQTFKIGNLEVKTHHLPGHTPDHIGYQIGDNVFCGDSLFPADLGTARADFPGGNAKTLWQSGRKLLGLPEDTKIWVGHDYPPEGLEGRDPYLTVGHHKKQNKHIKDDLTEDEYVKLRNERDATLAEPKLLHQSLQINIRAGRLPKPTDSGLQLLHLPLKTQGLEW
ncbi:hypothetical protein M433DRAFT_62732 [Acidomyces richmondensis BFW]|nr:MAG: hypothetical protein FE78DRAFT_28621 [Acidomyces sp. 'richmondensis']KYG47636.1 hypothetical protein M433DRAFT_62732 [Acidomyces richmondensis BFW]